MKHARIATLVLSFAALMVSGCLNDATKPGEIPSSFTYNDKPLDPGCFAGPMMMTGTSGIPIESCTGKTAGVPYMRGDGFYGMELNGNSSEAPAYVYYKYLGEASGNTVLQVDYADGSGARYSDLRIVSFKRGKLYALSKPAGGDRCNGSVTDAAVINDQLAYSQKITPFDLIELSGGNGAGFRPYDDIEDCTDCCIGTVVHKPNAAATVKLERTPGAGNPQDLKNGCFFDVYNEISERLGQNLDAGAVQEFGRNFDRECSQFK